MDMGSAYRAARHPERTNMQKHWNMDAAKIEAEVGKLIAEAGKLLAETTKLNAETAKLNREHYWMPVAAGATAMAGMIGAAVAIAKMFI